MPTDHTGTLWLLAIDTSSSWTGIALTDGERVIDHNWDAGRQQTTTVMVAIDNLLNSIGLTIRDLSAIAVASGPGSFSGLRVGMSIAKGFALALGIPLIGVPTLQATLATDPAERASTAAIRAGRARYVWSDRLHPESYSSGKVEDLIAAAQRTDDRSLLGEFESVDTPRLRESGINLLELDEPIARAGSIARIGWASWQSGQISDLATLEPIYVHGTGRTS